MSENFPQTYGRYQLKERLAIGGMAELFLAEVAGAHGFAKSVVIKRILPHLAADAQFTSMFISEAKFTAQLAHPKIAQTLELGNEGKQLFIVMEYIDGLDVLALLRECAHRRARIPAEVSVYIIKEVLDALDFAHKLKGDDGGLLGIVHRDVSPSNILLSTRGDVKLIDFGIAHAVAQKGNTNTGTLKGKYGYMSPEQVLGQVVSPRSDIFAAGVVLSEMLMGRRLFAAANELDVLLMVRDVDLSRLERFGKHIEDGLESFLRWALRKDPGDRYQDAGVFRDVLDEWLFEQRHRVSAAQLADIVNSLYEDAVVRRKESLKNNSLIQAATESLAVGSDAQISLTESAGLTSSNKDIVHAGVSVAFHPPPVKEQSGVPTGMDPGDRAPDSEPSLVIEVSQEMEASSIAIIEDTAEIVAPLAKSRRAETALGSGLSQERISELDDGLPIIESDPADVERHGRVVDVHFDTLGEERDGEIAEELKESPAYNTISAAVASVSPMELDPASRDFDDSDVVGEDQHRRPNTMPTTAQFVEPPPTPTIGTGDEDAARCGSLEELCALGTLYHTTAKRETGKIILSFGGVRKEIFFRRGVPEFVSSNIASELFGAYLVRMDVIASGELDMALAVMPHFGGKLGDTLVGLGLMKPLEVFRHLTRQVRSKLIEVCTWTQGEYEWFPGVRCPKQSFPLDLDPLEVYGAGAMSVPLETLEAWCHRHRDIRPIAARSSVVVPELFQVSGIRQRQERMNGTRNLEEIFAHLSVLEDGLHQLRLIFLLMNTNLLIDVNSV